MSYFAPQCKTEKERETKPDGPDVEGTEEEK